MRFLPLVLWLSSFVLHSYAQEKDWELPTKNAEWEIANQDKKKTKVLLITEGALYALSMVGLNELWYKDYPRSNFHFINDNAEWLQMDKVGHFTASYNMGLVGMKAYRWAGFNRKEAIWYGGISGSIYLTVIEILDGFSSEWGASSGDLLANTSGSALCIAQALLWDEQKIQVKYSYNQSYWAKQNLEILGTNYIQNMLKDYNGQEYWLSFNVKSILQLENKFPQWVSVAVGYGAEDMKHPYYEDGDPNRSRQYYLALDLDLNRMHSSSKFLNAILHTFGFVKFPMPTLEWQEGNWTFYYIRF